MEHVWNVNGLHGFANVRALSLKFFITVLRKRCRISLNFLLRGVAINLRFRKIQKKKSATALNRIGWPILIQNTNTGYDSCNDRIVSRVVRHVAPSC